MSICIRILSYTDDAERVPTTCAHYYLDSDTSWTATSSSGLCIPAAVPGDTTSDLHYQRGSGVCMVGSRGPTVLTRMTQATIVHAQMAPQTRWHSATTRGVSVLIPLTDTSLCCLKSCCVVDGSDELIVAYWGNTQDRNSTGVRAFQRQLYQCMIAQGLSLSQNIQQRRGGGAGAQPWCCAPS